MTIGERERETGETARTIRRQDSRDPCLGGAGAESDTNRERDWERKLDFPVTLLSDLENVNSVFVKSFQDALLNWIYKILVAKIVR